ncbi:MAG: class II aldolase/adducin family protein, partial [Aestuariivirgaceae bacterium]
MSQVSPLKTQPKYKPEDWQQRVDLAAAFRLAARMGWHEAVANHFSLAVSPDGKSFLMNPKWMHFSRIRASDLQLLDATDKSTMVAPDAPDITA